jgi:hypothetical protein
MVTRNGLTNGTTGSPNVPTIPTGWTTFPGTAVAAAGRHHPSASEQPARLSGPASRRRWPELGFGLVPRCGRDGLPQRDTGVGPGRNLYNFTDVPRLGAPAGERLVLGRRYGVDP